MMILSLLIVLICAYLLGAIPFGLIFASFKGVNLLECGSRNTGATNAFRCAGPVVGILTGIFDILKGFVAVWITSLLFDQPFMIYLAGVAAIFGHTKSVFIKFKGGKAIATSFGVFLSINSIPILLTAIVWIIVLLISRMVSLASISAGVAFPIISLIYQVDWLLFLISLSVAIYAVWRHKDNIKRILNGTESKIGQKKRELL